MNRFATIRRRLVYTLVCRSPDSTSPPGLVDAPRNSGGAGFADVTDKANVHITERAEGAHALINVNTDGSTLVFNRKLGSISAMADGDDILIKGLLARKVAASQTDGEELAVLNAPAGLLDIATDARIHVEAPIRFGSSQPLTAAAGHSFLYGIAAAVTESAYAQAPTEERREVTGDSARRTAT